ncbi:hypothetical protein GGTG_09981 [Gaeumannomyces tritici R3-111a-1]|uniref:Uncharacterized protein n=1 Tax=Gaeumannomyces tritici (strain R3-111a-1) TaxID=644352 RepID=J3P8Z7_GAET3|nr:hypothetical protein GGTG_09981 [Gaeumannomyces tritici R3-111a-1]EJT73132.1 hypothetical protein GGTG_09981 [Gaeumannomyces tritici R3-111a-1]
MEEMYQRGAENKITFAPEKTEMIHITRSRTGGNPDLQINGRTIQPITARRKYLHKTLVNPQAFKRFVADTDHSTLPPRE